MLLRIQTYDELQTDFFILPFRANDFHPEVRGYELLSTYDASRWPIRFK